MRMFKFDHTKNELHEAFCYKNDAFKNKVQQAIKVVLEKEYRSITERLEATIAAVKPTSKKDLLFVALSVGYFTGLRRGTNTDDIAKKIIEQFSK